VAIGLIAGNGNFPLLVLRAARQVGHEIAVVAIEGEATADVDRVAAEVGGATVSWIQLGQLGACIKTFKAAGVSQAVMAGHVKHVRLFGGVFPDMTLLAVLAKLKSKNTDALIGAVADVLQDHGITLMNSIALLPELVAKAGVLTRTLPTPEMHADFDFGYRVADALAGADVGQTVVVKDRAVVAVEGMDGTDATITRAGQLAGSATRVVKVAKPHQDMRFDVPVVGLTTIATMQQAGSDALTIDAGKTLILDGERFVGAANEAGIVVVGRPPR